MGVIPGAKSASPALDGAGIIGAKKSGKPAVEEMPGFEAQLAAAALIAPATPALPVLPSALAQASTADAGAALAMDAKATGLKASGTESVPAGVAANLKAASSITGSAFAGLKVPKSTSAWVFDGQNPLQSLEGADLSTEALALEKPATEASVAQAARGETDTALSSKLDLLLKPAIAGAAGQVAPMDASAAAQGVQQPSLAPVTVQGGRAQATTVQNEQMLAITAAHDAALEGQLASMGGVVLGLDTQAADAPMGTTGTKGRSLVSGAKGKLSQGGAAQAGLSGGEFLTALGAAKAGIAGSRGPGNQGGQTGEGQGEGKGATLGAKPSLKSMPGGSKSGAAEFGNELITARSLGNLVGANGAQATPIAIGMGKATEVTAHVVQGANAESRLTSETLAGIAGGLRNLSAQSTGGEMRIRLKPENLGELHVRVVTDGRNVGLQIQASDEKAKKVIEESMSHLKDSLAAQSLSLGTVDLTVAQSHGSSFGANQGHEKDQSHWQSMSNDTLSQSNSGQSHNREGRGGGEAGGFARSSRPATLGAPAAAQAFGPARAAYAASGRLDVTA